MAAVKGCNNARQVGVPGTQYTSGGHLSLCLGLTNREGERGTEPLNQQDFCKCSLKGHSL